MAPFRQPDDPGAPLRFAAPSWWQRQWVGWALAVAVVVGFAILSVRGCG